LSADPPKFIDPAAKTSAPPTADPRGTLLAFLESAYRAGAHASGWDADDLESSWRPDFAG
jgi:hypothetical protein